MEETAPQRAGQDTLTEIIRLLDKNYPEEIMFLNYKNSFELLVSVILSAQTTDRQVMQVVPALFSKYPDAAALSSAKPQNVMEIIRPVGFYRVKARNIINAAAVLISEFGGEVPDTIEKLVKIPGVGRKSANVITGAVFGKPAIIVDTHFGRVVRRLGLTGGKSPEKIEIDMVDAVPGNMQYRFSMTVNLHGRLVCMARKPLCGECFLNRLCISAGSFS